MKVILGHFNQYGLVSCPDPPSGGCGEREKEGLGNNPGWKCPERKHSATGVD